MYAARAIVLCPLLALSSCATTETMPSEEQLRIDAILDRVSATYEEDEEARTCLSTSAYRDIDVIDESRLIFWGGRQAWLNDLRRECNGLRDNDILKLELQDNRVCNLDFVRAVDPTLPRGSVTATCVLGKFKPIPPGQAEAIRELMRADKAR